MGLLMIGASCLQFIVFGFLLSVTCIGSSLPSRELQVLILVFGLLGLCLKGGKLMMKSRPSFFLRGELVFRSSADEVECDDGPGRPVAPFHCPFSIFCYWP